MGTNKAQIVTIDIGPLLEIENFLEYPSPTKTDGESVGKISRLKQHKHAKFEDQGYEMDDMEGMDEINLGDSEEEEDQI